MEQLSMTIPQRSIRIKRVVIDNFIRSNGPLSLNMTDKTVKKAVIRDKNHSDQVIGGRFNIARL